MAFLRGLLVCSVLLLSCICNQALGSRLLGGLVDASPEEPGASAALQFAMNEYNRGSNDMYHSRVSEVVQAQKQIVSGIKYYFTVKIGRTVCRNGASDLENCAFHNTPKLAQSGEIGGDKSVRWHTIRNMHWKERGGAGSPEQPPVHYTMKPMYSPLYVCLVSCNPCPMCLESAHTFCKGKLKKTFFCGQFPVRGRIEEGITRNQQTMTCTFEVYNIPWMNVIRLEKSSCT